VSSTGLLRDPQPIGTVVSAPNQHRGSCYSCEIVRRDTRHAEFPEQATGELRAWPTGPFKAVGEKGLPARTHLLSQAVEVSNRARWQLPLFVAESCSTDAMSSPFAQFLRTGRLERL
jgi:hypothetical protein